MSSSCWTKHQPSSLLSVKVHPPAAAAAVAPPRTIAQAHAAETPARRAAAVIHALALLFSLRRAARSFAVRCIARHPFDDTACPLLRDLVDIIPMQGSHAPCRPAEPRDGASHVSVWRKPAS
jgi:hypothetical protein